MMTRSRHAAAATAIAAGNATAIAAPAVRSSKRNLNRKTLNLVAVNDIKAEEASAAACPAAASTKVHVLWKTLRVLLLLLILGVAYIIIMRGPTEQTAVATLHSAYDAQIQYDAQIRFIGAATERKIKYYSKMNERMLMKNRAAAQKSRDLEDAAAAQKSRDSEDAAAAQKSRDSDDAAKRRLFSIIGVAFGVVSMGVTAYHAVHAINMDASRDYP
jgi:hypothetical protein